MRKKLQIKLKKVREKLKKNTLKKVEKWKANIFFGSRDAYKSNKLASLKATLVRNSAQPVTQSQG